ncbi:MAG: peptidase domain-containing ABC transporter [Desulfovibrionaceae bacterium]|nr:peptidase domain-containing ABC transporter [Desulfovibrionaceae bacterium]
MKNFLQRSFKAIKDYFCQGSSEPELPRPQSNTSLTCFRLIALHHGLDTDEARLAHRYALSDLEPPLLQLKDMALDLGLKAKIVDLPFSKSCDLEDVYPVLCPAKKGTYFILAGVRKNQDDSLNLAVINPSPSEDDHSETYDIYRFWSKEDWEKYASQKGLLLKKRYKLTDEQQPFGLRWFIPEFFKLRGLFGQIALAVLVMTLLTLLMPLFFQIVIDKVLPNSSFTTLNVLGVGICIAILFHACMEFLRNYLLLYATKKIDINTAMKTFAHLMRLPVSFFEAVPSGLLIKHMQQSERIRGFLSGNLFFTILELCSLLVFIPFLLIYSVPLTGIVLFFSMLMVMVVVALIRPFQRRLDILYQAEGKRQSRLVESLHGIHTVKSLALEPIEERDWNNASAYAIDAHFQVGKISITASALSQMLEMLMNVAVIWAGAHLVFNHTISIGALIAFQMLSGRVSGPLVKVVGLVHEYQQTALSVKMLGAVMNTPEEHPGGGVTLEIKGEILLEQINFRYQPNLPEVLTDINLEIKAGEVIDIVGRSGSGKSTLTRLIQAMYQPNKGIIRIDGIDIRELDKAFLRSNIGIVLQDNYFFQGTIRENIRLTRSSANPEEVVKASIMAGAHEFVSKLPRGYDTILEENASNLSGGQKQRLAIARALLANPKILILDEATSALDPESELIVQKNLALIAKSRTVLIISHRLSMVRHANRIIVMDGGKIIACAPHDILVHREGLYQDFWHQQMGTQNAKTYR